MELPHGRTCSSYIRHDVLGPTQFARLWIGETCVTTHELDCPICQRVSDVRFAVTPSQQGAGSSN